MIQIKWVKVKIKQDIDLGKCKFRKFIHSFICSFIQFPNTYVLIIGLGF